MNWKFIMKKKSVKELAAKLKSTIKFQKPSFGKFKIKSTDNTKKLFDTLDGLLKKQTDHCAKLAVILGSSLQMDFLAKCENPTITKNKRGTISDVIASPMQRPPRYMLLLKEISKKGKHAMSIMIEFITTEEAFQSNLSTLSERFKKYIETNEIPSKKPNEKLHNTDKYLPMLQSMNKHYKEVMQNSAKIQATLKKITYSLARKKLPESFFATPNSGEKIKKLNKLATETNFKTHQPYFKASHEKTKIYCFDMNKKLESVANILQFAKKFNSSPRKHKIKTEIKTENQTLEEMQKQMKGPLQQYLARTVRKYCKNPKRSEHYKKKIGSIIKSLAAIQSNPELAPSKLTILEKYLATNITKAKNTRFKFRRKYYEKKITEITKCLKSLLPKPPAIENKIKSLEKNQSNSTGKKNPMAEEFKKVSEKYKKEHKDFKPDYYLKPSEAAEIIGPLPHFSNIKNKEKNQEQPITNQEQPKEIPPKLK